MADRPRVDVSLVCTVLNEAATIGDLLASISAQTVRPREVIIVDGGSRDGTQLHAQWWHGRLGCPLRLIERTGTNIAAGRNIAIEAARAPIVAVTDAGVWLEPDWLASITEPFRDPTVGISAGFFVPDPSTVTELAMGATVLPSLADVSLATFLPSSRSVAFRRSVWERIGGYPEWLDYCEDLVFDLAARVDGIAVAFAPGAVAHFRPRPTLRAHWHQYFRYARGDGKAALWGKRHAIRYLTYATLVATAVAGKRGRFAWPFIAIGVAGYMRRPYGRLVALWEGRTATERIGALALLPVIRAIGDAAKMAGYPVGVVWRIRHRRLRWSWHDAAVSTGHQRTPLDAIEQREPEILGGP